MFPHVDTQIVSPITASRGGSVTCSKTPASDAPTIPYVSQVPMKPSQGAGV